MHPPIENCAAPAAPATAERWTRLSQEQPNGLMDDALEDGVRVTFLVPGQCQGQIVEVAYAGCGAAGVLRRTTDRSDGSVAFAIREWEDDDEDLPGLNFEPR
ncbi:MAG: hypothetical protein QM750_19850 [Rubrivivax sp.]